MGWNYFSIPKLQWFHHWTLGMDKYFHPIHYNGCNNLSMLGLKLIHVSKKGPMWVAYDAVIHCDSKMFLSLNLIFLQDNSVHKDLYSALGSVSMPFGYSKLSVIRLCLDPGEYWCLGAGRVMTHTAVGNIAGTICRAMDFSTEVWQSRYASSWYLADHFSNSFISIIFFYFYSFSLWFVLN